MAVTVTPSALSAHYRSRLTRFYHPEWSTLANGERVEPQEEGANTVLADAIDTFLANWLIDHIRDVDMKLGAFFKEKGVEVTEL